MPLYPVTSCSHRTLFSEGTYKLPSVNPHETVWVSYIASGEDLQKTIEQLEQTVREQAQRIAELESQLPSRKTPSEE